MNTQQLTSAQMPGNWRVCPVGDHFIVTRHCPPGSVERPNGGPEYLSNTGRRTAKFRNELNAERAADEANVVSAYRAAMKVAPDCPFHHAAYYVGELIRLGYTERAARAVIARANG